MYDEITLVSKSDTSRTDIGTYTSTEIKRTVLCVSGGINRSEWAAAGQTGHRPALMVTVSDFDYQGETEAVYHGKPYRIYRTRGTNDGWDTELYLEQRVGVCL